MDWLTVVHVALLDFPANGAIAFANQRESVMASFTIAPLTEHTGSEINGLDFTKPVDPDTRDALNQAFAERHVLVIREQHFTPDQFKAAAQVFGELQPHNKKERHVPGHPDIDYISNEEFAHGKRIISGETFHTDHSNYPQPPKATALFAVDLPSTGGDTQYVNAHNAYDDLPDATKRRIDGLKAVHVFQSKYSPRSLGILTDESRKKLPPPGIHPLVRTHPENSRKALYLNPVRIESIIGMPDDEALALIDELMRHATQKKYEYRHKWRHGDWVLWDNRSVMHQANPDYDMRERRCLYRILLMGETPV
jgi:taurine dioxygenase